jgi:hypothetical protein
MKVPDVEVARYTTSHLGNGHRSTTLSHLQLGLFCEYPILRLFTTHNNSLLTSLCIKSFTFVSVCQSHLALRIKTSDLLAVVTPTSFVSLLP